jgi:hypothetical protein
MNPTLSHSRVGGTSCSASKIAHIFCHSGPDPESSVSELDSRRSLPRTCRLDPTTGYGAGMTGLEINVWKR